MDNPFGYYERYSGADVSLKPLEDAVLRLAQTAGVEAPAPRECAPANAGLPTLLS